jgi:hypothetical protein
MDEPRFEAWQEASRKALLIGIDAYTGEKLAALRGCVNDMDSLAIVLAAKFDFAVVRLSDAAATRQAILEAMQALLDAAKEGDQIVFAFSGHGSTLTVDDDGRVFETLVPCDSSREGWAHNRDITDRELFGWVWQVSEKTPFLTLIIDGCQSGSIVRDLQARPRGAGGDNAKSAALARDKSAFVAPQAEKYVPGPSGWLPVSDRYTLLASCRSDEFCREVEDRETGLKRGLFSFCLHQTLWRRAPPLTWRELFEEVEPAVTQREPSQHPQLEGQIDRLVFGQQIVQPEFFLPLLSRQDGRVALGGGAAHGVCHASTWAVGAAGSRGLGENPSLGVLEVERVGATRAEASVLAESGKGAIAEGQRAFEIGRPIGRRIRVLLAPSAQGDEDLRDLIGKSPVLTLETGREAEAAEVVVHLLAARKTCPPGAPLPQVPRLPIKSWVLLRPSGAQLASPIPVEDKAHRLKVVKALEIFARHLFLSLLRHPDENLSLAGSLHLQAYRLRENARYEILGEEELPKRPTLAQGTRIAFRLRHRHLESLQLTLISLGLSGGIEVLFPPRGRFERTRASNLLEIGFQAADAMVIGLPEGFPLAGEPRFRGGVETLLFLLTETPTRNLPLQAQKGLRSRGRERILSPDRLALTLNPGELALKMTAGELTRTDGAADLHHEQEAWGLLRWSFDLEP